MNNEIKNRIINRISILSEIKGKLTLMGETDKDLTAMVTVLNKINDEDIILYKDILEIL